MRREKFRNFHTVNCKGPNEFQLPYYVVNFHLKGRDTLSLKHEMSPFSARPRKFVSVFVFIVSVVDPNTECPT